jgi:hypothetical protein
MSSLNVTLLVGMTMKSVVRDNNEAIYFESSDGRNFIMRHDQDCCEAVFIEDICGDLSDLIGTPILMAEEVSNSSDDNDPDDRGPLKGYDESYTWTFYKFSTIKGSVTIRWYGSSNGYYSESVDFDERF